MITSLSSSVSLTLTECGEVSHVPWHSVWGEPSHQVTQVRWSGLWHTAFEGKFINFDVYISFLVFNSTSIYVLDWFLFRIYSKFAQSTFPTHKSKGEYKETQWIHLFVLSLRCVFECRLKLSAREDANSHWLHLFDFSALCVLRCLLNSPALLEAWSHWMHLFCFSPLCIFKCVLKWYAWMDA